VQESVAAGADLITFSGDKLLGGPQAGMILGRKPLIEQLRRHPMARALRVDKMTLAALEATLRAYRRGRAATEIPVWRMIAATAGELHARAEKWQAHMQQHGIAAAVWPGESAVGGGSLPGETLPTFLLAIPRRESEAGAAADRAAADRVAPDRELQDGGVAAAAARLRLGSPAVVCRIQKDHLLFDPRTVLPFQEEALLRALVAHLGTG
jgi:L-seryl-tRNA(Ser) seleniumtransferase